MFPRIPSESVENFVLSSYVLFLILYVYFIFFIKRFILNPGMIYSTNSLRTVSTQASSFNLNNLKPFHANNADRVMLRKPQKHAFSRFPSCDTNGSLTEVHSSGVCLCLLVQLRFGASAVNISLLTPNPLPSFLLQA